MSVILLYGLNLMNLISVHLELKCSIILYKIRYFLLLHVILMEVNNKWSLWNTLFRNEINKAHINYGSNEISCLK